MIRAVVAAAGSTACYLLLLPGPLCLFFPVYSHAREESNTQTEKERWDSSRLIMLISFRAGRWLSES